MNNQHTPGPWGVSQRPDQGIYDLHAAGHPRAFAVVQSVCDANCSMGSIETHANAILIAAAPDLLKALQGLLSADFLQHISDERIDKALAAISKATS